MNDITKRILENVKKALEEKLVRNEDGSISIREDSIVDDGGFGNIVNEDPEMNRLYEEFKKEAFDKNKDIPKVDTNSSNTTKVINRRNKISDSIYNKGKSTDELIENFYGSRVVNSNMIDLIKDRNDMEIKRRKTPNERNYTEDYIRNEERKRELILKKAIEEQNGKYLKNMRDSNGKELGYVNNDPELLMKSIENSKKDVVDLGGNEKVKVRIEIPSNYSLTQREAIEDMVIYGIDEEDLIHG